MPLVPTPPARTFRTHHVRRVESLDGVWTLHVPREGDTIDPVDRGHAIARPCDVPGCWEQMLGLENYRGEAVAVRRFQLDQPGPVRLVFGGVSHTARVFVDGEEVGRHHNAYTAFDVELASLEAGPHELAVHVSNAFGELSALHVPNDYYTYGGLTRPVELQRLARPLVVRYAHVTPERDRDADRWAARLAVCVTNFGDGPIDAGLRVRVAGRVAELAPQAYPVGPIVVHAQVGFDPGEVQPWSPDAPRLYEIAAELVDPAEGEPVDDLVDRFGFRTVAVSGDRVLLNGEPITVAGFNRHEDHAEYGCALPLSAQRHDLELMVDLGANMLRTSHYPNDPRTLDLCDEMGLMVWEENHARGLTLGQMQHPRFREQCRDCIAEMIEQHFNHPSIILWGLLNECDSVSDEGRAMYAEQFAQVRELDRSRPVTFASCKYQACRCQDLPDVASWNIYPGWYHDTDPAEYLASTLDYLEAHGGAGKPVIISEAGAGAIPGYLDPRRRGKWSEDRQADILDELLDKYFANPRITGVILWQFCDVRVDEAFAMNRPRTMNNKGVVDEHRRPKLAYDVVRDHFRAITGHDR